MTLTRDLQQQQSGPGVRASPRLAIMAIPLASFVGAFLGCFATFQLGTLGLPPALASASATLLLCAAVITAPARHLLPTTFSSSAYGGSFSGMTSIVTLGESVARAGLPVELSFLLLSLFCGFVFGIVCAIEIRLQRVLLQGYGGRFGAVAAVASFLFLTLAPWLGADGEPLRLARLDEFDKGLGASLGIFLVCMIGTFVTLFALRSPDIARAGRAVRIFTAAAVAIFGLAILQQVPAGDRCLADAYYAGCFLGMSSPQRMRGPFQPVVAAAVLTVFLVQASTILPSVGGSLGLAAFVAVVVVDATRRTNDAIPPAHQPLMAALGRSLVVVFTAAGLLLPNDVFRARQVVETTGAIPRPAVPAAPAPGGQADAPAAEVPAPAAQVPAPADPVATLVEPGPAAVAASAAIIAPVAPPVREASRPRRVTRPATGASPLPAADPALRRNNRVAPPAAPGAAAAGAVPPAQPAPDGPPVTTATAAPD